MGRSREMGMNLYMVGLRVRDSDASAEFYKRLGMAVPEKPPTYPHIPVQMAGKMTFFMDTRYVHREDPDEEAKLGGYKVLFEFYMPSRAEVEAKYNEMVAYGYRSYHSPFETTFGMYFALVDDPDGNTVLLSAS